MSHLDHHVHWLDPPSTLLYPFKHIQKPPSLVIQTTERDLQVVGSSTTLGGGKYKARVARIITVVQEYYPITTLGRASQLAEAF